MKLKLKRPLLFFDLETTGLSIVKDRICQLSFTIFYPDKDPETKTRLVNPTIPIPVESSKVHNIYDESVKDEPTFPQFAKSLSEVFDNCDIAGYNINNFDVPILREEFLRAGIDWPNNSVQFFDVYTLFTKVISRSLSNVYELLTDQKAHHSHDAEYDNMMCIEVLTRLIQPDVSYSFNPSEKLKHPSTVNELVELCHDPEVKKVDYANKITIDRAGEYVYNFGQHRGEKVTDHPGFAKWMLVNDFTQDTKQKIKEIFKWA